MKIRNVTIVVVILMAIYSFAPSLSNGQVQQVGATDCPDGTHLIGWAPAGTPLEPGQTWYPNYWDPTEGWICEEDVPPPPPPVDVCDNLPGDQSTIPSGRVLINGDCIVVPPPPVCEEGEELINGVCVEIPPPDEECEEGEIEVDGECQPPPPPPPCEQMCVEQDPQHVECVMPLASLPVSITFEGAELTFYAVYGEKTNIQFIGHGDLLSTNPIVKMNLADGEQLMVQMQPNVDFGYSKGCYTVESTTWVDGFTPDPGSVYIAEKKEEVICPE